MSVPEGWYESDEPESKRLHIGSGTWYADGWVNVDSWGDFGECRAPDVVADASDLPFPDDYFDQIYMGHFLEHIPLDVIPVVLAELHRVAKPDCRVAVVGPCMDLAVAQNSPDWLLDAIRETPGETSPGSHKWTSTGAKTQAILESCGMDVRRVGITDIHQPDWCNPNHTAIWQCAFFASWPTEKVDIP